VWAGCSPVRVSATGSTVYVTARESDELLAFSAADLIIHPAIALRNQVEVGEAPVGLAVVEDGKRLVIANSNRFSVNGENSDLSLVSVSRDGALRLIGYIATGSFPRDITVSTNGAYVFLSNYGSDQVQQLNVDTLP
jgi:DNA-binding beta-propeller fold protein YncE